ncbi:MAG TPA: nitroreductase [Candidatus Aerophobetes bacterium]|uniref:Nitroreductase n=1 Tax=Aerophobetes bacterium TaxID=2030807 RepID=A0A7V0QQX5_UNCAE|nr:nitroreductase [Candidatus Aerophobetes bacterium]
MSDEVYQIIMKRRTIRKFKQEKIPYHLLEKFVNAGRVAPSAANLQPLRYIIINKEELLPKLFSLIKFAGYIDWNPSREEMPRAYIVIISEDEDENTRYDVGLAAENIILTALEEGVGSCCIRAFEEDKVRKLLNIPHNYTVQMIIAMGYPAEDPVYEELKDKNDSIKYWKDSNGVLHVPKRRLEDIIYKDKYK